MRIKILKITKRLNGDRSTGFGIVIRYRVSSGTLQVQYQCKGLDENTAGSSCQTISGDKIDKAVGELLLEMMNPKVLNVALAVQKELQDQGLFS